MSDVVLYQSVLQKLGQVSPKDLLELDIFLSQILKRKPAKKNGKAKSPQKPITHLFGAWKDWDDEEFQSFLNHTSNVRANLFSTREFML